MKTAVAFRVGCALLAFGLAGAAAAQGLIIYPSKGQSQEQQNKDQGECQIWAKNNTGIDPLALANQASQPTASTQPQGERARGAVRGAAGGAAIGAIAGDAGKGAAAGAAAGTMVGGARQRENQAAAQQQANAKNQNTQAQLATYNKAYAACLEGRGYSVK
ncbi:MAG: glycine zipper family protein [Myxococcota bacterium]